MSKQGDAFVRLTSELNACKDRAEKAEAELLVDKALADEAITILADRDRLREALRCIQQEPRQPLRVAEIARRALASSEAKEAK